MTVRTSTIIHEGAMYAALAGALVASLVGARLFADLIVDVGAMAFG